MPHNAESEREKYIYGSAWVRSLEAGAIGYDRIRAAASGRTEADALRMLDGSSGDTDGEALLTRELTGAYAALSHAAPDSAVFDVFRYPYDCHNIKSALKIVLRAGGERVTRAMREEIASLFIPVGTLGLEKITEAAAEGDFSALPENMAAAAKEACALFARTRDPQLLDALVDSGCFRDMAASAAASGEEYLAGYVRARADTTNIVTALRVLRLYPAAARLPVMRQVMLPCGKMGIDFFLPALCTSDSDEEALLSAAVRRSDYAAVTPYAGESLSSIEGRMESYLLAQAREAANAELYGAASIAAYILGRETAVRNMRILLAGKSASLPADAIIARLRR